MVCSDCRVGVCVGSECPLLRADLASYELALAALRAAVKIECVGGA